MGVGDGLKFDAPGWGAAGAANTPPPPLTPVPGPSPGSIIDNLLAVLGAAWNTGVPGDDADAQAGQAERAAKIAAALTKFPANEEQSAAQLAAVGQDGSQLAEQIPQLASGIAGGISGALGGALQPLSQIPQQVAQAGQQAMQMGMGALQQGAGGAVPTELLGAEGGFGGGAGELLGAGGGGGIGGTTPTAVLGPPPIPSAATVPASSPATPPTPPGAPEPATAPRGAMGAMPMVPPGAMAAGVTGSGAKPDTKRIVAPSVKNGAPVQGRITTPPPVPEVPKHLAGKLIATRRIVAPDSTDEGTDPSR